MKTLNSIVLRKGYHLLNIVLVFSILLLSACSGSGNPDAEKAAMSAALEWLDLIDAGMYEESWEVTADHFKKSGSKERWIDVLDTVRKPRGRLLSRKIQTARYKTRLPDAPIGEYVVVKFDADFENRQDAVETVITVWDKESRWRVIGYTLD